MKTPNIKIKHHLVYCYSLDSKTLFVKMSLRSSTTKLTSVSNRLFLIPLSSDILCSVANWKGGKIIREDNQLDDILVPYRSVMLDFIEANFSSFLKELLILNLT